MIKFNNKEYSSSSEIFFDIFNDRLKLMIIWYLKNSTLRFKELFEYLQPITKKTLTIKLKELEQLNLIHRKAFADVPPKVEYSLTEYGNNLKPVIDEILIWSQTYAKTFGETISEDLK
ncbi:transcriptional regulator, HxlR family [Arcobacter nitrofigilis DSM 7299]|uniref:Transcriptional regulator, HxlR family n=1 Tax=Arcobacter nitrofigilis (strain ATCC 33309 / DSM 7299 / CCUG 15893 / LMG 7604 / NCTC 12251 / CI) TaxID=572480 RepID=D5V6U4_ARCNC|nr:helix-turn-helix domain-containing protein [Arcobacter nitrofigilis]ADG94364.1 transcriptional regulator, HxlR family [Arcobacter nitrofigilis DSM 7299]